MNDKTDIDRPTTAGLAAAERDRLRQRLLELPDTMPPRAVWTRIEEQARAEGLLRRPAISAKTRWLAGTGIAAAVVLAVLNLPSVDRAARPPVAVTEAETLPTEPAWDPDPGLRQYDSINALMVQSQLLERDLRRLPNQPQVARAGTVATIDELQSRIAAIDHQLNDPDARLTREDEEAYWRERVRLMDSLVLLRYAQAGRTSF